MKAIIFQHKFNANLKIEVVLYPNGEIKDITKPKGINFPFSIGKVLNMNHKVWACNNNYLIDGKDACGDKKIFGIKVKDIPHGHPLRTIYPSKFN